MKVLHRLKTSGRGLVSHGECVEVHTYGTCRAACLDIESERYLARVTHPFAIKSTTHEPMPTTRYSIFNCHIKNAATMYTTVACLLAHCPDQSTTHRLARVIQLHR